MPNKFVPINTSEIKIYFFSSGRKDTISEVSITVLNYFALQTSQLYPGKYVTATYGSD
jgi:hypothetical protein